MGRRQGSSSRLSADVVDPEATVRSWTALVLHNSSKNKNSLNSQQLFEVWSIIGEQYCSLCFLR